MHDFTLALAQAVCDRHELTGGVPRPVEGGTNAVFAVGDAIVKLYGVQFARLAPAELAVLRWAWGRVPVTTPEVRASGTIEGWPYVVMGRLPGRTLHEVLPTLADVERTRLVHQAAELLAAIHALPTQELVATLEGDWPSFVRERVAGCVARHREQDAPEHLVEQMPEFLSSVVPLYSPDPRHVLVTGDFHDYHLHVQERSGRWELSGLFDFDDARLGFYEYDVAAAALFLGTPGEFFAGYGAEFDPRRLLAYTLLHRYRELRWVLREYVGHTPRTLDEVARALYS